MNEQQEPHGERKKRRGALQPSKGSSLLSLPEIVLQAPSNMKIKPVPDSPKTTLSAMPVKKAALDDAVSVPVEHTARSSILYQGSFSKATLYKSKGAYAAAACLFAEALQLAGNDAERSSSLLERMSCCVKVGDVPGAKECAMDLDAMRGTLTKVEQLKLDAVLEAVR